jgi:Flp pilus assembly protein TadD
VEEVEQCWRKVFATLGVRTVLADLSAFDFVDRAGRELLVRMHAAGFASAAFVSTSALDPSFGLARGFDLYEAGAGIEDTGAASRPAGNTIDLALAWLEHAHGRFFLFVQLDDPHAPYAPPEPYRANAAGRPYDGEISYADAELGRLLAALDARFPDERTFVLVTADHGESLGEHGEETHGYGVYDATQRVPLLLAGPGVPAGRVVTELARLADVTPTLLELAGLPAAAGLRGSSLAPAFSGEPEQEPRVAWVETLATQLDLGWSPLLGVRTATHKYIRAPHPELYALADDPGETKNLAADQPAVAARLDALVAARAGTPPGATSGLDPKAELARLARLREALVALSRDRGPEALEKLRELGELGPDLERLRGEAALLAGELAQARASALRARELEPAPTAPPLVLLGRVEEAAGRLDAAETAFLAAHDLDPESGAALLALGRVAERRGDRTGGRARYEAASRVRLVEPEALWRLAFRAFKKGDFDGAIDLAERGVDTRPLQEEDTQSIGVCQEIEQAGARTPRSYPGRGGRNIGPSA